MVTRDVSEAAAAEHMAAVARADQKERESAEVKRLRTEVQRLRAVLYAIECMSGPTTAGRARAAARASRGAK